MTTRRSGRRWLLGVARGRGPGVAVLALLGLGLELATSGCASAPPPRPLVLVVTNALGRSIEAVEVKDCDASPETFSALADSRFEHGEVRRFVLPPTCVDLVAYDARGRVVGRQSGLTMRHGAEWTLRR